jgi:E3 ubiquitin-protein ligase UBR1
MGTRYSLNQNHTPEDHLMAAFDYPLRVCAWLAQMKAGMWVRNGMSLRHQMATYRGVSQRDVSHHRDIFLLQTAMVVCPPARVLVSMIDRYGLEHWMKGLYEQKSDGLEDGQTLDVVEDMIHLLIVLISDRTSLVSSEEEPSPHILAMRRDITHVLCFKPLSFSEICSKLPDKFQDQEECQNILDEMTTFKAPEGLSDVGTFELKEQFLEDIDPYIAHYNKNQREESENAYKTWMAKKTGRAASDIVFEPKLRPVESGAFADLSSFTRTGIFAQIIYYSLLYPLKADLTPNVPATRVEAFLQVVLHLILIAIAEDKTDEDEMSEESLQSFVYIALTSTARSNFLPNAPGWRTIAAVLEMLSSKEEYKACHSKITLVLKRMKQKQPRNFENAFIRLGVPVDRISTASPANNNILEERERKKQAALARQAKVMAQFQQQQKNFLDNQGDIDWGEDDVSDENFEEETGDQKTYWQFPSSTCILCQEETKDGRLYGTFALMTKSTILRETDFQSPDFMREVTKTPASLDHSADSVRPFGVAGENREQVHKVTASGVEIITERQYIGKGFPSDCSRIGPVSVGCGHIMHYKCFEVYVEASQRRHQHQIARHHPENLELNEFVCPLCKALGNAFLPVIWGPKEELSIAHLQPQSSFENFLNIATQENSKVDILHARQAGGSSSKSVELFMEHDKAVLVNSLSSKLSELLIDAWEPTPATPALMIAAATGDIRIAAPNVVPAIWANSNDGAGPSAASPSVPTVSPMHELVDIYCRLNDTMTKNELPSVHPQPIISPRADSPKEIRSSDTLAQMLGISISAVEIQQRGVANLGGMTFIESMPQQAVTHLRVLAETASSYVSIGGIKSAGDNPVAREFSANYERQQRQLFLRGETRNSHISSLHNTADHDFLMSRGSLLNQDQFLFLTEACLCLAHVENLPILHLVQLCYLAEIVKVVLKLGRNKGTSNYMEIIGFYPSEDTNLFQRFCTTIYHHDRDTGISEDGPGTGLDQPCFSSADAIQAFVKKYALVFLRKVTLLLHVRYGIAFQSNISTNPDADELDRLTEALRLPTFDQMCMLLVQNSGVSGFVRAWIIDSKIHDKSPMSLGHPAIFELIGLPKNYDTLMEETMKRRCPTTGKDVSDPMLCLFCGVITCGQSICCLKPGPVGRNGRQQDIGGAQQHMLK